MPRHLISVAEFGATPALPSLVADCTVHTTDSQVTTSLVAESIRFDPIGAPS